MALGNKKGVQGAISKNANNGKKDSKKPNQAVTFISKSDARKQQKARKSGGPTEEEDDAVSSVYPCNLPLSRAFHIMLRYMGLYAELKFYSS